MIPTNIIIGSYGDISFTDFLTNLTPGVMLAFIGLLIYSSLTYRKELAKAHGASPMLMEKLAEAGKIEEPENLKKAGISDSAGYPITYMYFLKKGKPALLVTVALATIWLLIRFL